MDTINNETPAGSDDVTSSPDTASVDTQAAEPTGTVDGVEGGEAGQALLAGKYKSPAELEKAYKELEGKLGDLGQKASVAELLQSKYGVTPEQLRAQIEQMEYQKQQERYAADPLAPVYDKVAALEQKLAAQEHEKALMQTKADLDKFLKENPAYESHKEKILKLGLTPGIGFNPETGEETGFDEIAREYFGEARAQGQQDAYRKIETKEQTRATGVSQSAPKSKLTLEDMAQMSVKDLEAVLPWADISNRP